MVTASPERAEGHWDRVEHARRIAAGVPDPELPMLTLAELGVLRGVEVEPDGTVVAQISPTYSGCPAVAEMRAEVAARLRAAGFPDVRVVTVLDPPWTTDRISDEGRRKLAQHGVAPPGPRHLPDPAAGRTWLTLRSAPEIAVPCPRCASVYPSGTSDCGSTGSADSGARIGWSWSTSPSSRPRGAW